MCDDYFGYEDSLDADVTSDFDRAERALEECRILYINKEEEAKAAEARAKVAKAKLLAAELRIKVAEDKLLSACVHIRMNEEKTKTTKAKFLKVEEDVGVWKGELEAAKAQLLIINKEKGLLGRELGEKTTLINFLHMDLESVREKIRAVEKSEKRWQKRMKMAEKELADYRVGIYLTGYNDCRDGKYPQHTTRTSKREESITTTMMRIMMTVMATVEVTGV